MIYSYYIAFNVVIICITYCTNHYLLFTFLLGVDRLSAPILSILLISAIFKTDLPIYLFFFFYNANKHTIYR